MEVFGLLALGNGGPGGGLPPVTSADNGKALTVVDGAWAAADNDFVVTFTKSGDVSGTWSADKTFIEVKNAYDAKKRVYGKMSATDVTSDPAFSSFTLLIPLSGIYGSMPVFSGTYQGQTKTVFVSFAMGVLSITAYVKEIEPAPASLVVNYTITGLPVAGVYPLSADKTLAEIHTAIAAGREVYGLLTVGTNTLRLPVISYGAAGGYVEYSGSGAYGSSLILWRCLHENNGANAYAHPLITGTMTYNSSTNTLAFTQ